MHHYSLGTGTGYRGRIYRCRFCHLSDTVHTTLDGGVKGGRGYYGNDIFRKHVGYRIPYVVRTAGSSTPPRHAILSTVRSFRPLYRRLDHDRYLQLVV